MREVLVAQSATTQAVPVVASTGGNVPRDSFKDHPPVADGTLAPTVATELASSKPELPSVSPLGSVQTAHLVQHLSETELRVGIQSGEFGKIDIHASMSQNQVSARIYVEHEELGKTMSAALPQLREQMSVDHRMDTQIELYNTGSSTSNGADRQQQHQQQRVPEQNEPASRDAETTTPQVDILPRMTGTVTTTGLDMHV